MRRKYGWKRDLPDHRDLKYLARVYAETPPVVDLRPHCPPVYDQGAMGSCTANAICAAIEFDQLKEHKTLRMPSRLFVYYNERTLEGTTESDDGASLRSGMKALNRWGYCTERAWPYLETHLLRKPHTEAYERAEKKIITNYASVGQSLAELKATLAEGFPVVVGISVYESFESKTMETYGVGQMPKPRERLLGGHAVLLVGYDQHQRTWLLRNSWGVTWGDKGYFTLPYPYLLNAGLSDDFWVVSFVPS